MEGIVFVPAEEQDISFIGETYRENLASLHGNHRTAEDWRKLLADEASEYYIIYAGEPVGWFRIDLEEGQFWLGMLQVKPGHHRKGIGRAVLSATEALARKRGFGHIGIHTTEDNLPARALYESAGYKVTEIGPCTTADGIERVGYTFEKDL